MTLRELLKQNELRVVEVAAGADGLARTISGAVMFDNPEMVNWMRAGEIMLTTGYFLLDDPAKQEKVLRDLAYLGVTADPKANDCRGEEVRISGADSKVEVWVVPTNEEIMIARDTAELIK